MSKQQRFAIGIALFAVLIGGGIFLYTHVDFSRPDAGSQAISGNVPIITEITLGTPLNADEATKPNPKLRQQSAYDTGTPLALRIKLNPTIQESVQVGARLITEQGRIVELDPSKIILRPGASTFCCWRVAQAGTYLMQIFRPEKTITSIPVTIRQSFTTSQ